MPAEADAPPDFVTPFTARAAASASSARRSSLGGGRHVGIEQIEIGEVARQQRGIGEPDIFVERGDLRHRNRAFRELGHGVAADVVGRDHRLALTDQHAQADIIALGTLRFLDAAVADLDALRDAAHGDRIGRVRAGTPGRLNQPLREI